MHDPNRTTDAHQARSWPFVQARAIVERLEKGQIAEPVIFSTGYGPSGLPHMGTFGEVARTAMVRRALIALTGDSLKTRLICVSDDMDGMRKIPDGIEEDSLVEHLHKPLSAIPDPFGAHASFGARMNARLCAFLDRFGFDYEFLSSTDLYKSGAFDRHLLRALDRHDDIMAVVKPTLGPERQTTYCPFLPISPLSGRVLYSPPVACDPDKGTMTFPDEDGQEFTAPVTGGHMKLQWKPDFGMRWAALGVDFEMFGKDHRANAHLYARICSLLGGTPPVQFIYELFLDEQGEKISKTRGNGIPVDTWLRYGPQESLSLFQFSKPRTAKRLSYSAIVRSCDDYLAQARRYCRQTPTERLDNPVWHIHAGDPPDQVSPLSYSMLLNLARATDATDTQTLMRYAEPALAGASRQARTAACTLTSHVLAFHRDIARKTRVLRDPTDLERAALTDLAQRLDVINLSAAVPSGEDIQTMVFDVGKHHRFTPLRTWFDALYQVLLGQRSGPRFASFIAIYGAENTAQLIRARLKED